MFPTPVGMNRAFALSSGSNGYVPHTRDTGADQIYLPAGCENMAKNPFRVID
jgi:hypothetical protein